jgi:hypothetical protein
MKRIPLLFQPEMAKATLENRKTQTRRMQGLQEINKHPDEYSFSKFIEKNGALHAVFEVENGDMSDIKVIKCPYGQAGDILWVKENHFAWGKWKRDWIDKKDREGWVTLKCSEREDLKNFILCEAIKG